MTTTANFKGASAAEATCSRKHGFCISNVEGSTWLRGLIFQDRRLKRGLNGNTERFLGLLH